MTRGDTHRVRFHPTIFEVAFAATAAQLTSCRLVSNLRRFSDTREGALSQCSRRLSARVTREGFGAFSRRPSRGSGATWPGRRPPRRSLGSLAAAVVPDPSGNFRRGARRSAAELTDIRVGRILPACMRRGKCLMSDHSPPPFHRSPTTRLHSWIFHRACITSSACLACLLSSASKTRFCRRR